MEAYNTLNPDQYKVSKGDNTDGGVLFKITYYGECTKSGVNRYRCKDMEEACNVLFSIICPDDDFCVESMEENIYYFFRKKNPELLDIVFIDGHFIRENVPVEYLNAIKAKLIKKFVFHPNYVYGEGVYIMICQGCEIDVKVNFYSEETNERVEGIINAKIEEYTETFLRFNIPHN